MEELFNLKYKDEVEELKDKENFEVLGDKKYLHHLDMQARLYWAFCRPSGSCGEQIQDRDPIVSIMAFNHSRLRPLKRFQLLHKKVIEDDNLRIKISNRSRMLFRDLIDNDFTELNQVLALVPQFLPLAIDQLINGRLWNDIVANDLEVTKFLDTAKNFTDEKLINALPRKLQSFEEFEVSELKDFLNEKIIQKELLDSKILNFYIKQVKIWLKNNDLHLLQKKSIESLTKKL